MNMDETFKKILEFENMLKQLKHNKANLEHQIKNYQTRVDSMKEEVVSFMKANGVVRTQTDHHNWSVRNAPPSVLIKDLNALPSKYIKIKAIPVKNIIKKDIQAGKIVEGALLANGKPYLTCTARAV